MDCTKLCESRASQLFPESTTLTSIDLSVYDDTGGSDYYNEDPYGKYSHLVANKGILIMYLYFVGVKKNLFHFTDFMNFDVRNI